MNDHDLDSLLGDSETLDNVSVFHALDSLGSVDDALDISRRETHRREEQHQHQQHYIIRDDQGELRYPHHHHLHHQQQQQQQRRHSDQYGGALSVAEPPPSLSLPYVQRNFVPSLNEDVVGNDNNNNGGDVASNGGDVMLQPSNCHLNLNNNDGVGSALNPLSLKDRRRTRSAGNLTINVPAYESPRFEWNDEANRVLGLTAGGSADSMLHHQQQQHVKRKQLHPNSTHSEWGDNGPPKKLLDIGGYPDDIFQQRMNEQSLSAPSIPPQRSISLDRLDFNVGASINGDYGNIAAGGNEFYSPAIRNNQNPMSPSALHLASLQLASPHHNVPSPLSPLYANVGGQGSMPISPRAGRKELPTRMALAKQRFVSGKPYSNQPNQAFSSPPNSPRARRSVGNVGYSSGYDMKGEPETNVCVGDYERKDKERERSGSWTWEPDSVNTLPQQQFKSMIPSPTSGTSEVQWQFIDGVTDQMVSMMTKVNDSTRAGRLT